MLFGVDGLYGHKLARLVGQVVGRYAVAASVMEAELRAFGQLAVAVFSDRQVEAAGDLPVGADDPVAFAELYAPDAEGRAAHGPYFGLAEPDGAAIGRGDYHIVAAARQHGRNEPVVLVQGYGPYAGLADIGEHIKAHALDNTFFGDQQYESLRIHILYGQHGAYALAAFQLQEVYDIHALGGAGAFGDLVALEPIHPAPRSKEKYVVVGRGREHAARLVLISHGDAGYSPAPAALGLIGIAGQALYITQAGQCIYTVLFVYEVLDIDIVFIVGDLGAASVAVLFLYLGKLLLYDAVDPFGLFKDILVVGDFDMEL